jgi:hypothetical protein
MRATTEKAPEAAANRAEIPFMMVPFVPARPGAAR